MTAGGHGYVGRVSYTKAHRTADQIARLDEPERWHAEANAAAYSIAKEALTLHPQPSLAQVQGLET